MLRQCVRHADVLRAIRKASHNADIAFDTFTTVKASDNTFRSRRQLQDRLRTIEHFEERYSAIKKELAALGESMPDDNPFHVPLGTFEGHTRYLARAQQFRRDIRKKHKKLQERERRAKDKLTTLGVPLDEFPQEHRGESITFFESRVQELEYLKATINKCGTFADFRNNMRTREEAARAKAAKIMLPPTALPRIESTASIVDLEYQLMILELTALELEHKHWREREDRARKELALLGLSSAYPPRNEVPPLCIHGEALTLKLEARVRECQKSQAIAYYDSVVAECGYHHMKFS